APPAAGRARLLICRHRLRPARYLDIHLSRGRSPDAELGHARLDRAWLACAWFACAWPASSSVSARISRATGRRCIRSLSMSGVLGRTVLATSGLAAPRLVLSARCELVTRYSAPVSTSRQRPVGTASAVSRQPPDRRRRAGSLVATVIACPPRLNATTCAAA